ncbi:sodium:proton antiporter [Barrientosiimonas marina]|uniref:Cation:proton antiporter n=1 Tax=Lentibacillus kimchii TaxID=1542911 RepID=A0ABW2UXR4_9BACI
MTSAQIILLLLIGYLIYTLDRKESYIPAPVVLVLTGIILSFIPYFDSIQVTSDLIYYILLPGLLFTSAYRFSSKLFRENAGMITFLATFGIIATVAILGSVIYVMSGAFVSISFAGALVVAAILTPTDPISVVTILKKSGGSPKIANVVEGESLINDGTSIVIFTFLSGMLLGDQSLTVMNFLRDFLVVSIGGVLIGIIFGWLMSKAVHITHNREYQVMLSIILAYGVFNLAEKIGVSGVLATVFAGIMLSFEYGRTIQENHLKEKLNGFWSIAELTILALLFLLIGIQSSEYLAFNAWGFAFAIFAVSLIIRFAIISGTLQLFPSWRHHVTWREPIVLTWSGLKGSMSVFLILELQSRSAGEYNLILSLAFAAVLISLIVQSLGITPLTKALASKED